MKIIAQWKYPNQPPCGLEHNSALFILWASLTDLSGDIYIYKIFIYILHISFFMISAQTQWHVPSVRLMHVTLLFHHFLQKSLESNVIHLAFPLKNEAFCTPHVGSVIEDRNKITATLPPITLIFFYVFYREAFIFHPNGEIKNSWCLSELRLHSELAPHLSLYSELPVSSDNTKALLMCWQKDVMYL